MRGEKRLCEPQATNSKFRHKVGIGKPVPNPSADESKRKDKLKSYEKRKTTHPIQSCKKVQSPPFI